VALQYAVGVRDDEWGAVETVVLTGMALSTRESDMRVFVGEFRGANVTGGFVRTSNDLSRNREFQEGW